MDGLSCHSCGNPVSVRSHCDYRLKDSEGRYYRYCDNCKEEFERILESIEDPTGLIIDEGIACELGEKDPFIRMRCTPGSKGPEPEWIVVSPDDESGGLVVFVRKIGRFLQKDEDTGKLSIACKIIIKRKGKRVAFAEPYAEEVEPVMSDVKENEEKKDEVNEDVISEPESTVE